MLGMPNEWEVGVKDEDERTGRHIYLFVRRSSLDSAFGFARDDGEGVACNSHPFSRFAKRGAYSVRQKSWNRSRPFLMISMLVA